MDRKSAPGREAAVTPLPVLVISSAHIPSPIVLVLEGVKRHNAALLDVAQDPVYTDISLREDIDGMNALLLFLRNGRSEEMISRVRVEGETIEDILSDTNWVVSVPIGRNAYARSLFFEVVGGSRIVVGL